MEAAGLDRAAALARIHTIMKGMCEMKRLLEMHVTNCDVHGQGHGRGLEYGHGVNVPNLNGKGLNRNHSVRFRVVHSAV